MGRDELLRLAISLGVHGESVNTTVGRAVMYETFLAGSPAKASSEIEVKLSCDASEITAMFNEVIEVALGPDGEIATALETLQRAVDNLDRQVADAKARGKL